VQSIIDTWLTRPRKKANAPVQVAFYGGSFTGLSQQRQQELLESVAPYIKTGKVGFIRLSTRPDYIAPGTAPFLKQHGVGIVELGVQSMSREVLQSSGRGYHPESVINAVALLKKAGLSVGIQMMVGLPGDTTARLMQSVQEVVALQPDLVRIYPTLVLRDSGLHALYGQGKYTPLSLNRAIGMVAKVKEILDQQNIRVVRMGLQPSKELEEKVVAGPYHPSFGELVMSRLLFNRTRSLLRRVENGTIRKLSIAAADLSAFRGPNSINMKRLQALGLLQKMELVCDSGQERQTVAVVGEAC
jgi:histone acetyltransferase (RNA polymerase elongator complex component)